LEKEMLKIPDRIARRVACQVRQVESARAAEAWLAAMFTQAVRQAYRRVERRYWHTLKKRERRPHA
jgi:hypothetical protein